MTSDSGGVTSAAWAESATRKTSAWILTETFIRRLSYNGLIERSILVGSMRINLAAWRFGAFELSESVYDAGTVLPPHSHGRAYLGFVVNGRHRETTSRDDRDCRPSSVVFHPAAERHSNRF